jgi:hypothetical protein
MRVKSLRLPVALVVLAALAIAVMSTSTASGQTDIHVILRAADQHVALVDVRGDGVLRQGDRVALRGPVLDETETEGVGRTHWDCVVQRRISASPDSGLYQCDAILSLEDGTIILEGLDPAGAGASAFAVVGGTGLYDNAQGDATLTDTETETDFLIHLAA